MLFEHYVQVYIGNKIGEDVSFLCSGKKVFNSHRRTDPRQVNIKFKFFFNNLLAVLLVSSEINCTPPTFNFLL